VELGNRRGVYAEGLLKTVRFCVESPLACAAGVTGADLKKRVQTIMRGRLERIGWGRKLALVGVGVFAITAPLVFGMLRMIPLYGQVLHASGPLPSYEVVVIKPAQDTANGADTEGEQTHYLVTAKMLIQFAYGVFAPPKMIDLKVVGGPDWTDTDVFDIVGKTSSADFEQRQKMNRMQGHEQRQLMEQSLLADRFHLKMHTEMQDQPVYALTVNKPGKMMPAKNATGSAHVDPMPSSYAPDELKRGLIVNRTRTGLKMTAKGMTLDDLSNALMSQKETNGLPVVNQTGLTDAFDFTLTWGPERTEASDNNEAEDLPLLVAIQQQLGLKLVNAKAPAEVVVIDHIEKPVFDSTKAEVAPAQGPPRLVNVAMVQGPSMTATPPPMQAASSGARFVVSTVKPSSAATSGSSGIYTGHGRLDGKNVTLKRCIIGAYGIGPHQVVGGPDWIDTLRWDIEAKADRDIEDDATLNALQASL
jgi:bla regulator protein BlaR1